MQRRLILPSLATLAFALSAYRVTYRFDWVPIREPIPPRAGEVLVSRFKSEYDGQYDVMVLSSGGSAAESGLSVAWTVEHEGRVVASGPPPEPMTMTWSQRVETRIGQFQTKKGAVYDVQARAIALPEKAALQMPTLEVHADFDRRMGDYFQAQWLYLLAFVSLVWLLVCLLIGAVRSMRRNR